MRPFRVVMVYIEPTPYIIALIDRLRLVGGGSIEAYYITTDLSQPWELRLERGHERVLPRGFLARMQALRRALTRDRESTILHLAGWGHPVLLGALLMARSLRIPVAMESDTAEGRPDHSWRHSVLAPLGEKAALSAAVPVAEPLSSRGHTTSPLSGAIWREAGTDDDRANDGRCLRHSPILLAGSGSRACGRAGAVGHVG